jgi:hypothetical protein
MGKQTRLELPAGGKRVLALKIEYPDWSGQGAGKLAIRVGAGATAREQVLPPGEYTRILVPIAASTQLQTVTIDAAGDFPLPAPDQRRRAARLVQAELQPVRD